MEKTLYEMEFDIEKMPLGMLTKSQIQVGVTGNVSTDWNRKGIKY